jgi:hypothetical protein
VYVAFLLKALLPVSCCRASTILNTYMIVPVDGSFVGVQRDISSCIKAMVYLTVSLALTGCILLSPCISVA